MFADLLIAYCALCPPLCSAPVMLQFSPTIALQGRCVTILCPFVHLYLWSEIIFVPPSSHLPNFYSFSKPSSVIISFMASLLTPQALLISSCEFHGINIILLIDHLPDSITQHSSPICPSTQIVFRVLGDKMGSSLSMCGYPNITALASTWTGT